MGDGTGHAEEILGLDGFVVLDVDRTSAEVVITVETTASVVGCLECGVLAEAQDRTHVDIRDLPCRRRGSRWTQTVSWHGETARGAQGRTSTGDSSPPARA